MLPMVVARSSSGGAAIRYVLPVLWMTSQRDRAFVAALRTRAYEHETSSVTVHRYPDLYQLFGAR